MMNRLAIAAVFSLGIVLPAWLLLPLRTAGASAAPVAATAPATAAAKPMSRREHMARLVAETAAARAEKTAREVMARKSAEQQTASR